MDGGSPASCLHLNPVKILQKKCSYLLKNNLAVKKGAALFKMASVKKVVKSKGQPRNGCDGVG